MGYLSIMKQVDGLNLVLLWQIEQMICLSETFPTEAGTIHCNAFKHNLLARAISMQSKQLQQFSCIHIHGQSRVPNHYAPKRVMYQSQEGPLWKGTITYKSYVLGISNFHWHYFEGHEIVPHCATKLRPSPCITAQEIPAECVQGPAFFFWMAWVLGNCLSCRHDGSLIFKFPVFFCRFSELSVIVSKVRKVWTMIFLSVGAMSVEVRCSIMRSLTGGLLLIGHSGNFLLAFDSAGGWINQWIGLRSDKMQVALLLEYTQHHQTYFFPANNKE